MTTLTQPYLFEPQGTVVDGWYVVDVYRGSDSTNVDGISWWTTDYCTAKVYAGAYGDKAIIMHRTIKLLVVEGTVCGPNDYLLGGRGTDICFRTDDTVDLEQ